MARVREDAKARVLAIAVVRYPFKSRMNEVRTDRRALARREGLHHSSRNPPTVVTRGLYIYMHFLFRPLLLSVFFIG